VRGGGVSAISVRMRRESEKGGNINIPSFHSEEDIVETLKF
jgi:hypothetical protein